MAVLATVHTNFLSSSINRRQVASLLSFRSPRYSIPSSSLAARRHVRCGLATGDGMARRSANFPPNFFDYSFVQCLSTDYTEEKYKAEVKMLKEDVKGMFGEAMDHVAKLEFIDAVQRLGLQYHFDVEIKQVLKLVHGGSEDPWACLDDLHAAGLRFRLLRQHGYVVSQDVFKSFMDDASSFKASLRDDAKGLFSLYEASFHGFEDETVIDEAKAFSYKFLNEINVNGTPVNLHKKVSHALDMPIHWRPNRLEARWFIQMYEEEPNVNPTLLRLAKLDFNYLQSIYKKEFSKMARWWVELGLYELNVFRDRMTECYIWSVIMAFEPEFGPFREMMTIVNCFITLMDDIYDVFGTLEELELLTDIIDRWDINGIDKLHPTIQKCYLAMFNSTNNIVYWTIKERGFNVLPALRQMWVNEFKVCLKEAKWYNKGCKPTLEEYLSTSISSTGGPLMLFCSFFLTTHNLTQETVDYVANIPSLMKYSSLALRCNNDLGTSPVEMARGDNPKSIHCYMYENGVSEEVARERIECMVHEYWKKMNKQYFEDRPFPGLQPFRNACLNLVRSSHCFYQYGDGMGKPNLESKDHVNDYVMSVLIESIPIEECRH